MLPFKKWMPVGIALILLLCVVCAASDSESAPADDVTVYLPVVKRPRLFWAIGYREGDYPMVYEVKRTGSNDYVLAGAVLKDNSQDIWVIKQNAQGEVIWQRHYGSPEPEWARDIVALSDGSLIVAGEIHDDFLSNHNGWLLKLDSSGSILWQRAYGTDRATRLHDVAESSDGRLFIAGKYRPPDIPASLPWIAKLRADGSFIWQRYYLVGESERLSDFEPQAIQATADGGLLIAGHKPVFNDEWYAIGSDALLFKLSASGAFEWLKAYDVSAYDDASDVSIGRNGTIVLAGSATTVEYQRFTWVMMLKGQGQPAWARRLDNLNSAFVTQLADGSYALASQTEPPGASDRRAYVWRFTANGDTMWQKVYGFPGDSEGVWDIEAAADGGLVFIGQTEAFQSESWAFKIDSDGVIDHCTVSDYNATISPISVTVSNLEGMRVTTEAVVETTSVTAGTIDIGTNLICPRIMASATCQ